MLVLATPTWPNVSTAPGASLEATRLEVEDPACHLQSCSSAPPPDDAGEKVASNQSHVPGIFTNTECQLWSIDSRELGRE